MKQSSETAAHEYASQEGPKQSKLVIGLKVAKMLLRNPAALKKLMVMGPDEQRFVRPPREYELPEYREGMKHCTSNEKYLRPTRWCNPREPAVIALANELGAYELSDWEFADAAFWWVKTKVGLEQTPMGSVSTTLKRGTGTCHHLISLWIALCRAAGIKARYKTFKTVVHDVTMSLDVTRIVDLNETEQAMLPDLLDFVDALVPGVHGEGEAFVDSKWVVADVGMSPEMQAHSGSPITRFGEDSIGTTFPLMPGTTIKRFESLPVMVGISMRAQKWLAPVVTERGNLVFAELLPLGRRVIEEAGGIDTYDQSVRRRRELFASDEIARQIRDAERPQFVEFRE